MVKFMDDYVMAVPRYTEKERQSRFIYVIKPILGDSENNFEERVGQKLNELEQGQRDMKREMSSKIDDIQTN